MQMKNKSSRTQIKNIHGRQMRSSKTLQVQNYTSSANAKLSYLHSKCPKNLKSTLKAQEIQHEILINIAKKQEEIKQQEALMVYHEIMEAMRYKNLKNNKGSRYGEFKIKISSDEQMSDSDDLFTSQVSEYASDSDENPRVDYEKQMEWCTERNRVCSMTKSLLFRMIKFKVKIDIKHHKKIQALSQRILKFDESKKDVLEESDMAEIGQIKKSIEQLQNNFSQTNVFKEAEKDKEKREVLEKLQYIFDKQPYSQEQRSTEIFEWKQHGPIDLYELIEKKKLDFDETLKIVRGRDEGKPLNPTSDDLFVSVTEWGGRHAYYWGQVNSKGQRHGLGRMQMNQFWIKEGFWCKGKMQGYGRQLSTEGNTTNFMKEGHFQNDEFQGQEEVQGYC